MARPGIDHRKLIDAQTSVKNAMFPIWQRVEQAEPKDGEAQRADCIHTTMKSKGTATQTRGRA